MELSPDQYVREALPACPDNIGCYIIVVGEDQARRIDSLACAPGATPGIQFADKIAAEHLMVDVGLSRHKELSVYNLPALAIVWEILQVGGSHPEGRAHATLVLVLARRAISATQCVLQVYT